MICCDSETCTVSQALLEDVSSVHLRASQTLHRQRLHSSTSISHTNARLSTGYTLQIETPNLLRGRRLKTPKTTSAQVSVPGSQSPPQLAARSPAGGQGPTCPRRFCPAHTDVWMIFRKSCPVLGLKMKMAPLMGFVVKFPSKV